MFVRLRYLVLKPRGTSGEESDTMRPFVKNYLPDQINFGPNIGKYASGSNCPPPFFYEIRVEVIYP